MSGAAAAVSDDLLKALTSVVNLLVAKSMPISSNLFFFVSDRILTLIMHH